MWGLRDMFYIKHLALYLAHKIYSINSNSPYNYKWYCKVGLGHSGTGRSPVPNSETTVGKTRGTQLDVCPAGCLTWLQLHWHKVQVRHFSNLVLSLSGRFCLPVQKGKRILPFPETSSTPAAMLGTFFFHFSQLSIYQLPFTPLPRAPRKSAPKTLCLRAVLLWSHSSMTSNLNRLSLVQYLWFRSKQKTVRGNGQKLICCTVTLDI